MLFACRHGLQIVDLVNSWLIKISGSSRCPKQVLTINESKHSVGKPMEPSSQPSGKAENQLGEKLFPVLKIGQKMNSEGDFAALLDLIAREATKLIEADRASLFLLDRERGELWSKIALGSEEIRFDARLGIAGAVA